MFQLKKQVKSQTVVLIFAGSAIADSRRKGFGDNAAFFEFLTQLTIDKVTATGIPYQVHREKQQQGATFGARLKHSIQCLFKQGYDQVIAVGNDSPLLSTQHLCKSLDLLNQGHTVLGPSKDGGFYLLGINRICFNQLQTAQVGSEEPLQDISLFEQLPWCKTGLFNELNHLLSAFGASVQTLEALADVDDVSDARKILRASDITRALKRLLLLLLSRKPALSSSTPIFPSPVGFGHYCTRGSPTYVF